MPSSHFSNNQKLDWDMDTLDLVPPVKPWRFLIVLCASERGQWLRHQKSEGMSRGWSQAKLNVLLVAFHIFKSMNNILLLYIYRMIVCVLDAMIQCSGIRKVSFFSPLSTHMPLGMAVLVNKSLWLSIIHQWVWDMWNTAGYPNHWAMNSVPFLGLVRGA